MSAKGKAKGKRKVGGRAPERAAGLILLCTLTGCGGSSDDPQTPTNSPVQDGPIVFVGDSITAKWALPANIVNDGFEGERSDQILQEFPAVLNLRPAVVVILAGSNDVLQRNPPDTDSISEMAREASAAGGCVILGTIPPDVLWYDSPYAHSQADLDATIANFNAEIVSLARAYGFAIADYHAVLINPDGTQNAALFADGIHPNNEGYIRMWQVVDPLLGRCR